MERPMKRILLFALAISALGNPVLVRASSPSIEEAAANCLAASNPEKIVFHRLDAVGIPYHKDGSVYVQAFCDESPAAEEYLKAASAVFRHRDEPYSPSAPDATRRVFFRDIETGSSHFCAWRGAMGSEEQKRSVACYFNMAIPGVAKRHR
jgi:hypothetical protein